MLHEVHNFPSRSNLPIPIGRNFDSLNKLFASQKKSLAIYNTRNRKVNTSSHTSLKVKSFTHQQDFLAGTRADVLLPRSPVASCQLSQNTYVNASHATPTRADKSNENRMTRERTKPPNGTVNNRAASHRKIILFLAQEKSPPCTVEASHIVPPTSAATFLHQIYNFIPKTGHPRRLPVYSSRTTGNRLIGTLKNQPARGT